MRRSRGLVGNLSGRWSGSLRNFAGGFGRREGMNDVGENKLSLVNCLGAFMVSHSNVRTPKVGRVK